MLAREGSVSVAVTPALTKPQERAEPHRPLLDSPTTERDTGPPPSARRPDARKAPHSRGLSNSGGGIRTRDLRVMRC